MVLERGGENLDKAISKSPNTQYFLRDHGILKLFQLTDALIFEKSITSHHNTIIGLIVSKTRGCP